MYYIRSKKGFTLMELLLALTLFSILIIPIGAFFVSNYRSFNAAEQQLQAQDEAQKAINSITESILDAKAIVSRSYLLEGNSVERAVFEVSNNNYLILQYLDSDSDGQRDCICSKVNSDRDYNIRNDEIIDTQKAQYIKYFSIIFKPDDINFSNSNIAAIEITAQSSNNISSQSVTVKTEVFMRNKR